MVKQIKRIVSLGLCCALVLSIGVYRSIAASEYVPCDATCDGKVNAMDILRIKSIITDSTRSFSETCLINADTNFDGKVNTIEIFNTKATPQIIEVSNSNIELRILINFIFIIPFNKYYIT